MIPLRILWRTGNFVSVKSTKNIKEQRLICAKFLENYRNEFKAHFTTTTNFMNNKGKGSAQISPNKSALFLYKCPKCNFCHEDKFKIKNHLKEVHQAKPYFCQKCLEEFTSFAKLLSHIKSKHKRFPIPKEPYELQEFVANGTKSGSRNANGPKNPLDSNVFKISEDISKKKNTNNFETSETLCTSNQNVDKQVGIKEQKKADAIPEIRSDVSEEKRPTEIKTALILSDNKNLSNEFLTAKEEIKKKVDISFALGWFNFASIFGIGVYLIYQQYMICETLHEENSIDETDSFNDIPKEEQENKDELKNYKMSADPRGLALIIDIEEFDDVESKNPKRLDRQDISELKLLFQQLKLTCIHKKNLKSHQLYEVLDSFSSSPEHAQADMMVLVILSQGNKKHMPLKNRSSS